MFHGISTANIDGKGRMAIPTRVRSALLDDGEASVMVTLSPMGRCLWLYPLAQWQTVASKMVNLPALNRSSEYLKHIVIGHADECAIDRSGRIRLSAELREEAQIDKRVRLVGQLNKYEIWSEELWRENSRRWFADGIDLDELSIELETVSL